MLAPRCYPEEVEPLDLVIAPLVVGVGNASATASVWARTSPRSVSPPLPVMWSVWPGDQRSRCAVGIRRFRDVRLRRARDPWQDVPVSLFPAWEVGFMPARHA